MEVSTSNHEIKQNTNSDHSLNNNLWPFRRVADKPLFRLNPTELWDCIGQWIQNDERYNDTLRAIEQLFADFHISGAVLCALYIEGIGDFDLLSMESVLNKKMKQYFTDKTIDIIWNEMKDSMKTIEPKLLHSATSKECARFAMEFPIQNLKNDIIEKQIDGQRFIADPIEFELTVQRATGWTKTECTLLVEVMLRRLSLTRDQILERMQIIAEKKQIPISIIDKIITDFTSTYNPEDIQYQLRTQGIVQRQFCESIHKLLEHLAPVQGHQGPDTVQRAISDPMQTLTPDTLSVQLSDLLDHHKAENSDIDGGPFMEMFFDVISSAMIMTPDDSHDGKPSSWTCPCCFHLNVMKIMEHQWTTDISKCALCGYTQRELVIMTVKQIVTPFLNMDRNSKTTENDMVSTQFKALTLSNDNDDDDDDDEKEENVTNTKWICSSCGCSNVISSQCAFCRVDQSLSVAKAKRDKWTPFRDIIRCAESKRMDLHCRQQRDCNLCPALKRIAVILVTMRRYQMLNEDNVHDHKLSVYDLMQFITPELYRDTVLESAETILVGYAGERQTESLRALLEDDDHKLWDFVSYFGDKESDAEYIEFRSQREFTSILKSDADIEQKEGDKIFDAIKQKLLSTVHELSDEDERLCDYDLMRFVTPELYKKTFLESASMFIVGFNASTIMASVRALINNEEHKLWDYLTYFGGDSDPRGSEFGTILISHTAIHEGTASLIFQGTMKGLRQIVIDGYRQWLNSQNIPDVAGDYQHIQHYHLQKASPPRYAVIRSFFEELLHGDDNAVERGECIQTLFSRCDPDGDYTEIESVVNGIHLALCVRAYARISGLDGYPNGKRVQLLSPILIGNRKWWRVQLLDVEQPQDGEYEIKKENLELLAERQTLPFGKENRKSIADNLWKYSSNGPVDGEDFDIDYMHFGPQCGSLREELYQIVPHDKTLIGVLSKAIGIHNKWKRRADGTRRAREYSSKHGILRNQDITTKHIVAVLLHTENNELSQ